MEKKNYKKIREELKKLLDKTLNTFPHQLKTRDPKRIRKVMQIVEETWKKYPQLRFCQLIGNCFDAGYDPYGVEDDAFLKVFKETYENIDYR